MTSTNTYTDQKNYPYVYRLDNLITKEFYIGYRAKNKVPAEQDLGTDYFTSAPAITERFNEFQLTIIAEFFNSNDAYDHEQYLIHCDWDNPFLLNNSCYYNKRRFNFTGNSHSDKSKEKRKLNYLEKTGYLYPTQNPETQEKSKQTCLEKYGVEYPAQNPEVQEKFAVTKRKTLLKKLGCKSEQEVIEKIYYFERLYNVKRYSNNLNPNLYTILKYFPLTAHKSINGLRTIFKSFMLISQ